MTIIYIQGKVDTTSYEELSRKNGFDPLDRKVVFLFPGNSGHHGKNVTLFSIKGGAGLATAASNIGKSGYPVLSLPTTTMEDWANSKSQQATVQKAIEDLYQAFGAGYSFMLPVRKHANKKYFDHGLGTDEDLEPSFWGGVQLAANKPLANHYISELNKLAAFMALTPEERREQEATNVDNPLYQAWLKGRNIAKDDIWLQPVVKVANKKPALPKKTFGLPKKDDVDRPVDLNPPIDMNPSIDPIPPKKTEVKTKKTKMIQVPASYETFFRNNDTPEDNLRNVREFLNDYTKNNSCISRFFHGHWNRHHVEAVNAIVKKIDNKKLGTVEDVMNELKSIKLCNPNGSLAKRIYFIEEKTQIDVENNEILLPKTF